MQTSNENIIQSIIDVINIDADRTLMFGGKPCTAFYQGAEGDIVSDEMLMQNLQFLIYTVFYTRGEVVQDQQANENPDGFVSEDNVRKEFIRALRKANTSANGWSKGWRVESTTGNGVVHAKKGNASRYVQPGEFIKYENDRKAFLPGEYLKLVSRREKYQFHESFYYAFGNARTEDDPQMLVRFYFNVFPEGGLKLMEHLTKTFNDYNIPFQFKCINDPAGYNRTDSAVLYINKRYEKIVFDLLSIVYKELRGLFKELCPLFTRKLSNGFAFAENPLNPLESFGTSRANLIARGILNAFSSGADKGQWYHHVIKIITEYNYRLDNFHLNPGSNYPYSFNLKNVCHEYNEAKIS